ncbi:MAG: LTA synthase family protein [Clostridia bacterium]|nr:LTA synthase family protein [Clostridia bacterium]
MEKENNITARRNPKLITVILCTILLAVAYAAFFAVLWYTVTYGETGFDSVWFTLTGGMDGVQSGLIISYLLKGLLPTVIFTVATSFIIFFYRKKTVTVSLFKKSKFTVLPIKNKFKIIVSSVLSGVLLITAAIKIDLISYIIYQIHSSTVFEEYYVDPNTAEIIFPENKRNLIFISVESLETTYSDKSQGGALDYNLIPNATKLAQENISFSNNSGFGGSKSVAGTTWTAGSMVAHTAGIPLKVPFGTADNTYGKEEFLSGATTLYEVLRDNGYYQAVMMGCDSHFANSNVYYTQHGVNKIYDYYAARDDKLFPHNYKVWWGYEDKLLYSYAKQELTKIAEGDKPFAFSIKTVDTHHVGGYVCSECEDNYSEQYENVISCADRQLGEFVEWIKAQPFFENTAIVIVGDHTTMDAGYISRNVDEDYERFVYNCIINASATAVNVKNRQFSAMDIFPTTLAAMGCEIKGDRLGLGTNLFSSTPTLLEEMGFKKLDRQMTYKSKYYNKNFINYR